MNRLKEFLDLAALSYECPQKFRSSLPLESIGFFDASMFENEDAQFYTIKRENETVFAIRGSSSIDDFLADVNFLQVPSPLECTTDPAAKVHSGFAGQFKAVFHHMLNTVIATDYKPAIFVGHSLGGALAIMCATALKSTLGPSQKVSCVTFGAPKVGNAAFAKAFKVDECLRCVNKQDAVSMRPYWGYYHSEKPLQLGKPSWWVFGSIKDHFLSEYKLSLKTFN